MVDMQVSQPESTLQAPQGELYLKFDLGQNQQMAFPAVGVLEVVDLSTENITPMPNMSPLLMGTFNLRGEILWLVDLSLLFQNTYLAPMTGQCPVILVPDEETSVGLAVFNIRGMAWLDAQQIRNASAVALEGMRPFVRGSFDLEEAPVLLLDPDAIIRSRPWTE